MESIVGKDCCGDVEIGGSRHWKTGVLETSAGSVDRITSDFSWRDRIGWWRTRCGIGRMTFAVPPGLHALGEPGADSDVFVTANYKMSFDHLRRSLAGRNAWILVLNTQGINVWCAAGKGTFSTDELVARIADSGLAKVVSHSRIILPQLGAVGVDAGEVAAQSGFTVRYGPVRADDIPAYLDSGYKVTGEMRRVRFRTMDRAVLIPVEVLNVGRFILPAMAILFVLAGVSRSGFSASGMRLQGSAALIALAAAWLAGSVLGPLLLPLLPCRMLSLKGALAAVLVLALPALWVLPQLTGRLDLAAYWLAVPAIASFIMMNFTGATPYTSPSGVRLEMKRSVPLQAICGVLAILLWLGQRIANG
jgi:acetyl-CoA decarbonylase/synthase complex subunit gamma